MATPGVVIDAVANMFALPVNAVAYPWRRLREAGAVSVSGRGKSAAIVTPRDVASLLIAIIAELPLKDCVEAWRFFAPAKAKLGFSSTHGFEAGAWTFGGETLSGLCLPRLTDLPADHTLLDAFTALILAGGDGSLETALATGGNDLSVEFESGWPSVAIALIFDGRETTHRYVSQAVSDLLASGYTGRIDIRSKSLLLKQQTLIWDAFVVVGELLRPDAGDPA